MCAPQNVPLFSQLIASFPPKFKDLSRNFPVQKNLLVESTVVRHVNLLCILGIHPFLHPGAHKVRDLSPHSTATLQLLWLNPGRGAPSGRAELASVWTL